MLREVHFLHLHSHNDCQTAGPWMSAAVDKIVRGKAVKFDGQCSRQESDEVMYTAQNRFQGCILMSLMI